MRRARRGSRRLGLTLIEVLVAVVVTGAGVAVVATGVSAAIKADTYAAQLVRAADHAELLLARIESGELELSPDGGTFEEDGAPELSWELGVDNTEIEGLVTATLVVSWTSSGIERELVVERDLFVDPEVGGVQ